MNLAAILYPITALVLAVAFGVVYHQGKMSGADEESNRALKQQTIQMEEYAAAVIAARKKEADVRAEFSKLERERDEAVKTIDDLGVALRNSLRNRPERPVAAPKAGGVSENTGTCGAASGAELARGDGEFLVGYATDVLKLQAELDHCVGKYNEIKQKYNGDTE